MCFEISGVPLAQGCAPVKPAADRARRRFLDVITKSQERPHGLIQPDNKNKPIRGATIGIDSQNCPIGERTFSTTNWSLRS